MPQSATSNFGWQNKFSTTLSSGITASDTTIPLTSLPTPSEGFLVIEPDSSTNWEVIYYTSKTGSAVVCTSVASGRGQDDSTAQSHSAGATVRMDTTAGMFEVLQNMSAMTPGSAGGTAFASGWTLIPSTTPNTVTYNGNRSYDLVFNGVDLTSYISAGMRLRTTRTVAAPNQSASLNGTTQYFSKTSPAGMTFTNNFVVSAWIKLSSYPVSAGSIASRYNGTSGWSFQIQSNGQVTLVGYNGGSSNLCYTTSYASVPLNKWVHVVAQLDMASYPTASSTTNYTMIDGIDVPTYMTRGGTNPTALVQAGNLEIGSKNGGTIELFPGKIAQVAIYNAKVTQSTIRGYYSQGLAGTETSLISAYSLSNSVNDLNTTNANNLTANGSATTTNADSPFGGQADGTISTTLDYAIIQKASFSTNTTLTVQVPEGCAIPTSGGVSAVSYSIQKAPYQMPIQKDKWDILTLVKTVSLANPGSFSTFINDQSTNISVPVGFWNLSFNGVLVQSNSSSGPYAPYGGLSTSSSSASDLDLIVAFVSRPGSTTSSGTTVTKNKNLQIPTTTTYYLIVGVQAGGGTITVGFDGSSLVGTTIIKAENNLL